MAERFFDAGVGALAGAAWGLLIAFAVFAISGDWHPGIVGGSSGVFAFIGLFFGNLAFEAFLSLIHFLWGVLNGLAFWEASGRIHTQDSQGHLRGFMLLGVGTGFALLTGLWLF